MEEDQIQGTQHNKTFGPLIENHISRPGVYTNVLEHVDWIKSIIEGSPNERVTTVKGTFGLVLIFFNEPHQQPSLP